METAEKEIRTLGKELLSRPRWKLRATAYVQRQLSRGRRSERSPDVALATV
jgi:hypothetical protein